MESELKVLAVEKSTIGLRLFKQTLKKFGFFKIDEVDTVRAAIKYLPIGKPDLILCELELKDFNSSELVAVLKSREEFAGIPLILHIQQKNAEIIDEMSSLGVKYILTGPPKTDKLIEYLNMIFPDAFKVQVIPQDIRNDILIKTTRIQQTSALPMLVQEIIKVERNPNSSAHHLGQVVKKDQSLTTRILKVVNSAYYGLSRRVGNIDHAIVILGFAEVKKLAIASIVMKLSQLTGNQFFNPQKFWSHSLCAAHVASALCRKRPEVNTDDAFVIGLLHDYGKIILYQYFNEVFNEVLKEAHDKHLPLQVVSHDRLEIDHAEIGAVKVDSWKLPMQLVNAIKYYHQPNMVGENDFSVHLAHLANVLSHRYGFGASGNPVPDEVNPVSLEVYKLKDVDLEDFWISMNIDLEAIKVQMQLSFD